MSDLLTWIKVNPQTSESEKAICFGHNFWIPRSVMKGWYRVTVEIGGDWIVSAEYVGVPYWFYAKTAAQARDVDLVKTMKELETEFGPIALYEMPIDPPYECVSVTGYQFHRRQPEIGSTPIVTYVKYDGQAMTRQAIIDELERTGHQIMAGCPFWASVYIPED